MAHTPGPWRWVGNELEAADYSTVLEVRDTPEHAWPEMQTGTLVMKNEAHDKPLIAAAPDLLEAAEAAIALIEAGDDIIEDNRRNVMGVINNAIRKARGE